MVKFSTWSRIGFRFGYWRKNYGLGSVIDWVRETHRIFDHSRIFGYISRYWYFSGTSLRHLLYGMFDWINIGVEQRISVDNTWGFPYSESSSSSSPAGAIASDNAPGGFPRSQSYKSSVKNNWPPSAKILAFKIVNKDFADFRILDTLLARSSGIGRIVILWSIMNRSDV